MKKLFEENFYEIAKNLKTYEEHREYGRRGLMIFPDKIIRSFFKRPNLNFLYDKIGLQMFCLNHYRNLR